MPLPSRHDKNVTPRCKGVSERDRQAFRGGGQVGHLWDKSGDKGLAVARAGYVSGEGWLRLLWAEVDAVAPVAPRNRPFGLYPS